MLVLVLISLIASTQASIYNLTSTGKAGIYFEHLGKVNHFDSEWRLITYLDISNIHKKINLVDNIFTQTKLICSNDKFNILSMCHTSLVALEQIIPQLINQHYILKDLIGHKLRTKRSYIDGIGSLFKLFLEH